MKSSSLRALQERFAAEVTGVEVRAVHNPSELGSIREAMDRFAVLVFRGQPLSDAEQLAFAERFDGRLHTRTGAAVLRKNRFGNEASFEDPPGRYSMLHARVIPAVDADTEFADLRAAYDELDGRMKAKLEGLQVHHSIAYSRATLGFEFSEEERAKLQGAVHPLVRTNPRTGRRSLYLASHASHVVGWPVPEGRLLLRELTEHATQPRFVYRHSWRAADLVIWDNLATMHRGRPFDDSAHRRELRRVTTLDLPS